MCFAYCPISGISFSFPCNTWTIPTRESMKAASCAKGASAGKGQKSIFATSAHTSTARSTRPCRTWNCTNLSRVAARRGNIVSGPTYASTPKTVRIVNGGRRRGSSCFSAGSVWYSSIRGALWRGKYSTGIAYCHCPHGGCCRSDLWVEWWVHSSKVTY